MHIICNTKIVDSCKWATRNSPPPLIKDHCSSDVPIWMLLQKTQVIGHCESKMHRYTLAHDVTQTNPNFENSFTTKLDIKFVIKSHHHQKITLHSIVPISREMFDAFLAQGAASCPFLSLSCTTATTINCAALGRVFLLTTQKSTVGCVVSSSRSV